MRRRSRGHRGGRHRLAAGAALAAAAALALSGCANPEYRFISSSEKDVVVQVPWDWNRIDRQDVLAARPGATAAPTAEESALPEGTWIDYYDGAPEPQPAHVLAESVDEPIVLLQSSAVSEANRATVDVSALRDLYRPVSEAARAQREALLKAGNMPVPEFTLIGDDEFTTRTSRGVHVVFSYGAGGDREIYDQVAALDADRSRWHVVVVHCSAACFAEHRRQIEAITGSFTVKDT